MPIKCESHTKAREKFEVFWKTSAHSFYGHSIDGLCFNFILFLSDEDMKMCRYISFKENAEDFTGNNFLKCVQVKKVNCVTLCSYKHEKVID